MSRCLTLLLKSAVAAGLIAWLLVERKVPVGDLGALREGWGYFAGAVVIYGVILFLAAVRWRSLLATQGLVFPVARVARLTLTGHFFNQFLLGSTGGDLVKAYYIARDLPDKRAVAVLTVFLDRLIGLVVLLVVAAAGVLLNLGRMRDDVVLASIAGFVGVALVGVLASAWVFYSPAVRSSRPVRWLLARVRLPEIVSTLSDAIYLYRNHPRRVSGVVLLSFGIHLLVVTMNGLLCLSLSGSVPSWTALLLVVPLAQIVLALPVSPGGWGTAEVAYLELFSAIGLEAGVLVSLLQRLAYFAWALPGGVLYIAARRRTGPSSPWLPSSPGLGRDSTTPPATGSDSANDGCSASSATSAH